MYKQEIQHKIISEVREYFPFIKIGIRFNDYFTEDTYVLVAETVDKNLNYIPFSFFKNNELISECVMVKNNIEQLLNDAFSSVEDYDMKNLFESQTKKQIIKEVNEFMNFYEKLVLVHEVTLEGELRRMKRVAGITPKVLF